MIMGNDSKISDFIKNYQTDTITIDKLYLKEIEIHNNDSMILLGEDILSKYRGEFDEYIDSYKLTDAECRRWHYNPKVMSYDLYGTTEYWFLLLEINQIHSSIQFSMNPVKYFTKNITDIINRILNLEHQVLEINSGDINNALLNKN